MNFMKFPRLQPAAVVLLVAIAAVPLSAQYPSYEAATTWIAKDYPDEEESRGWWDGAQGVTHDSSHWFFSKNTEFPFRGLEIPFLMKAPKCQDLRELTWGTPDVIAAVIPQTLREQGYNHYGDLSYYYHKGNGYILNPITAGNSNCPALAIFRADDLSYVAHKCMEPKARAGAVGVDPEGRIYMAEKTTDPEKTYQGMYRWQVQWDKLEAAVPVLDMEFEAYLPFTDLQGRQMRLNHQQGIALSPSGDILYFVNGYVKFSGGPDPGWGIHVFDNSSGDKLVELEHSTDGFGRFDFKFFPSFPERHEPEGVTFWDLDRSCAPGISGQLHVILLDNDYTLEAPDDIFLKHYRLTAWVDGSAPRSGTGIVNAPHQTVTGAHNAAWPGSVIKIIAGDYPETGTYTKQVRMEAVDGTVRIGTP